MVVISTPPEIIRYLHKINAYTESNLYNIVVFLLDLGMAMMSGNDDFLSFSDIDNYIDYQHDALGYMSDEEIMLDRHILEDIAIQLASLVRLNNIDNPYVVDANNVVITIDHLDTHM